MIVSLLSLKFVYNSRHETLEQSLHFSDLYHGSLVGASQTQDFGPCALLIATLQYFQPPSPTRHRQCSNFTDFLLIVRPFGVTFRFTQGIFIPRELILRKVPRVVALCSLMLGDLRSVIQVMSDAPSSS